MPDENLLQYIRDGLSQGRSEDVIHSLLASNGWAQKDIDDAFNALKMEQVGSAPSAPIVDSPAVVAALVGSGGGSRKGMRTWVKVLLWVLGIVVALGAVSGVVWMAYGKTLSSLVAIRMIEHASGNVLDITPTPHALSPITPETSTTFSYLGLTFSAPWTGVSSTKAGGSIAETISFTSGKKFTIMKETEPMSTSTAELYDIYHASSSYGFEEDVYNATSGMVTLGTPGDQAVLATTLLIYKSVILVPESGPLYNFSTRAIEGFQHGDPTSGSSTFVEFFDQAGDKFNLITQGANQGEIDYILASIQPGAGNSSAIPGIKVYKNDEYGFEITYPSSWVTSTDPEATGFLLALNPEPQSSQYGFIGLSAGLMGSCMSTEQVIQSSLGLKNSMITADMGPVTVNDPNVDARQVQPVVGKGATVGGVILLSNKGCNSSSTAVLVRIYDSDFADRTQAQQNAYFKFISTFQFIN